MGRRLSRVVEDLKELGKVEQHPSMEGRTMTMVVAPIPKEPTK